MASTFVAGCAYVGAVLQLPDGSLQTVPEVGASVGGASVLTPSADPQTAVSMDIFNFPDAGPAIGVLIATGKHTVYGRPEAVQAYLAAHPDASSTGTISAADAPEACDDNRYILTGAKWTTSFQWHYNSTNEGAPLALARVKDGVAAMAGGVWRCSGTHKSVSPPSPAYVGTTSLSPDINLLGNCATNDSHSIVGWGALPSGVLARTCWWPATGTTTDADMKFSTAYSWFDGATASSCSGSKYDIAGVATHESGHVYGLNHVSVSKLVMKVMSQFCDTDQRALGWGDIEGMHALYP